MQRFALSLVAALALAVLPLSAQGVQVFGGNAQRAASTVVLFGDGVMGGLTLVYGQPEWRPMYDAMLDKLTGKINRLGKDFWTTFMTSFPVEIGGTKVPAGSYVVGLHCDDAGKFSLVLHDAGKAMAAGVMPFGAQTWTPEYKLPLTLNRDTSKEAVSKMTMELKADGENLAKGTFTLAWGTYTLTAPLAIHTAK